jgi:3-oxoacyl-[acyl-carrier-protein] synthase-3
MHYLNSMRPEALPDFVMLVTAENSTRVIDYSDRIGAALVGDASVAAIVSPRVPSACTICFTSQNSAVHGWRHSTLQSGGHFRQSGTPMKGFAREKVPAMMRTLRAQPEVDGQELRFIGHQVSPLLLDEIRTLCEVPESMHMFNVDRFGSCASAGAPSVLSQRWETLSNTWVAMVIFGAGLSWGGLLLKMNGCGAREKEDIVPAVRMAG